MTFSLARPRLLPLTILALAAVLYLHAATMLHAVLPGGTDGAALAAEPPQAAPPPPATPASPAKPPAMPAPAAVPTAVPASASGSSPAAAPADPPVSASERGLLLDLRKRRQELDAREQALAAREAVLSAAQARLTTRLDELAGLQKRLEALEAARRDRDETNWRGLVKLYETMKPKDAAAIFNDLESAVLLPVLDRMKESKAAAIFAAMLPDRARAATTELAQMRAKANTVPPAVDPAPSVPSSAKTAQGS